MQNDVLVIANILIISQNHYLCIDKTVRRTVAPLRTANH